VRSVVQVLRLGGRAGAGARSWVVQVTEFGVRRTTGQRQILVHLIAAPGWGWLYIVVLTVGYMISRGIAKAGSRHHSDSQ
jgi:hypothetical protein